MRYGRFVSRIAIMALMPLFCGGVGTALAQITTSWGSTLSSASSAQSGCDDTVASQITQNQALQVAVAQNMAKNMYPFLTNSYSGYGCLSNLLSGSGVSGIFTPPSLDTLTNSLLNMVCSEASQYTSQYENQEALLLSNLQSYSSLNLGQVAPGVSLGAVPMGFQVSNGTSGSVVQTNLGQEIGASMTDVKSVLGTNVFGL